MPASLNVNLSCGLSSVLRTVSTLIAGRPNASFAVATASSSVSCAVTIRHNDPCSFRTRTAASITCSASFKSVAEKTFVLFKPAIASAARALSLDAARQTNNTRCGSLPWLTKPPFHLQPNASRAVALRVLPYRALHTESDRAPRLRRPAQSTVRVHETKYLNEQTPTANSAGTVRSSRGRNLRTGNACCQDN